MTALEDALRQMFTARAGASPPPADAAARAIRRARTLRRRRAIGSSVAATVAFALTLSGGVWLRGWSGARSGPTAGFAASLDAPPPTPDAGRGVPAGLLHSTRIGLDLRVDDRLWTADGRRLVLDGVGDVRRVYRVPAGWVYGGATQVRLLREDGSSIGLTAAGPSWVVSPQGDRLAVVADAVLRVGTIGSDGLTAVTRLPVPAGAAPVAFLGDRIVIAGPRGYDHVDPASRFKPTWNSDITGVLGPYGDGALGLVTRPHQPGACLATLAARPAGLRVARTGACLPQPQRGEPAARLSPAGDWLAQPTTDGITLLDVAQGLAGRRSGVACAVRTTVAPAWADESTVVVGDHRGVVRCGTDGTREALPLPPGVGARWQLVPKLTPATPG